MAVIVEQPYYPGIFVARVINALVGIIEAVLFIRVVFELFAANPGSPFIAWFYGMSGALMAPFNGAFAPLNLGGGSAIDVVAILAMIVYALIGWIIVQLLSFIFVSTTRV